MSNTWYFLSPSTWIDCTHYVDSYIIRSIGNRPLEDSHERFEDGDSILFSSSLKKKKYFVIYSFSKFYFLTY